MLGQLAIPVGLAPAVRGDATTFARLHAGCGAKLEPRSWCPVHDRLVTDDEVVRGYEITPGQHLELTDTELATARAEDTRVIDVVCALREQQLPALAAGAGYYLTPSEAPVGRRPYELLRRVLAEDYVDVHLLVRLAVRGHDWAAAVSAHPSRRLLVLRKLHPAEAVVDPQDVEKQLADVTITEREQELAREVVGVRIRSKLPKDALHTADRERLTKLIDAKLAGGNITIEPRPAGHTQPQLPAGGDLTDILRRSIRQQKKPRARPAPIKR